MYINELDFSWSRKKPILATFHKVFSVFTLCYELVKEQRDKQSQIHRTVLHQPRPQTAVSLSKGDIFLLIFSLRHSHKKQKDSLETWVELFVLHSYVEHQDILEPILLYRACKCIQTKEHGWEDCLWTIFLPFL